MVQALVVEEPALRAAVKLLSRLPPSTYSDMFLMRRAPTTAIAMRSEK